MTFTEIFALSLGAILTENFIFVKFLGICPFLGVSKKTDTALGMGLAVIFVMTISSAVTYLLDTLVLVRFDIVYMRTIVCILVIAALVQFVEMVLMKLMPALYQALGIYLPLITTNCAVLGAALLNVDKAAENPSFNFLGAVTFGMTGGIGFTLAIVLFASIREKFELADYPKAFEGFPIALVTASLLSIAFMGFQGLKVF